MTSFSISEDGQVYSALTSNNTCALLDVGVSQGKAAWEFLLEDDSPRYVRLLGMCRAFLTKVSVAGGTKRQSNRLELVRGAVRCIYVQPIPRAFLGARMESNSNAVSTVITRDIVFSTHTEIQNTHSY